MGEEETRVVSALVAIMAWCGFCEDEYHQPDAIPLARAFIAHWAELLRESPGSIIGPLASLLTDVRRVERDLLVPAMIARAERAEADFANCADVGRRMEARAEAAELAETIAKATLARCERSCGGRLESVPRASYLAEWNRANAAERERDEARALVESLPERALLIHSRLVDERDTARADAERLRAMVVEAWARQDGLCCIRCDAIWNDRHGPDGDDGFDHAADCKLAAALRVE